VDAAGAVDGGVDDFEAAGFFEEAGLEHDALEAGEVGVVDFRSEEAEFPLFAGSEGGVLVRSDGIDFVEDACGDGVEDGIAFFEVDLVAVVVGGVVSMTPPVALTWRTAKESSGVGRWESKSQTSTPLSVMMRAENSANSRAKWRVSWLKTTDGRPGRFWDFQ
jgi:hypothetical protein